jgi:putative phosphoesterase
MRTAVLADVHGNLHALEAVLAEATAEGCDELVCLGDLAVLGAYPAECIDRLRALGDRVRFVQGNTDRYLAEGRSDGETTWTAARIGPERIAFLASLPTEQRIASADARCVHGSPRSDEERIEVETPAAALAGILAGVTERVLLHGHTHVQYWRLDGTLLVGNPGSVGFPCDGEQTAAWALVDGADVNLRRTAYPVAAAIAALEASDSPVRALAIGRLRTATP